MQPRVAAGIESRSDGLLGLKENIIIGKLIPAGSGMTRYQDIQTFAPDYQPLDFYSSEDTESAAQWLANLGTEPEPVSTASNVIGFPESGEATV